MMKYTSMHNFGEELVDCRRFQIECEFSNVSQRQLKDIAAFYIHSVSDWLGNAFVLDWCQQNWPKKGRRISSSALLLKNEKTNGLLSFGFFGNANDSPFNSIKQMDAYAKRSYHLMNASDWDVMVSVDYWDVYHQLFHNVSDPEEIRQNLLTLFRMENRYYKQRWLGTDVLGHFNSFPYWNKKDLYYGHFDFRIAVPCLCGNESRFSNLAVEFLKHIASIAPDTSGRITVSPITPPSSCSSYMDYFGGYKLYCPLGKENDLREREWTRFYFLRGVEWFNLLTPLQTSIVKDRPHTNEIVVSTLPNGGSTVAVNKSILQTQISDLCALKQYLYPVLYPGGIEIPIDALLDPSKGGYIVKPRCQWETVPVLEEEIIAHPDKIVIQYQTSKLL